MDTSAERYQSRFERLAQQVEHPEPWKPDPGDTLVGEVVRWELVEPNDLNELSRACDVCVIRDEAGKEWAVWTWHYKLRLVLVGDPDREPDGDFAGHAARSGDFVAVNFRGKREKSDGSGQTVAQYNVAIEKSDGGTAPNDEFGF